MLSVDLSPASLATARRNVEHNAARVAGCEHTTETGDAFDVLRRMVAAGDTFDLVIVDPPSFAHKQADVDKALGGYRALAQLAVQVVRNGGTLVQSSCSSRIDGEQFLDAVSDGAWQAKRTLQVQERTGHAVDHPIGFAEGAYLKTVFCEVRR